MKNNCDQSPYKERVSEYCGLGPVLLRGAGHRKRSTFTHIHIRIQSNYLILLKSK